MSPKKIQSPCNAAFFASFKNSKFPATIPLGKNSKISNFWPAYRRGKKRKKHPKKGPCNPFHRQRVSPLRGGRCTYPMQTP